MLYTQSTSAFISGWYKQQTQNNNNNNNDDKLGGFPHSRDGAGAGTKLFANGRSLSGAVEASLTRSSRGRQRQHTHPVSGCSQNRVYKIDVV